MELIEIKRIVYREVCQIQEWSGRTIPREEDILVPLLQCEGFDSVNGAETAVRISTATKCPLPTNPFAEGNRPLSIDQVAKNIFKKLSDRRQS